MKCRSLRRRQCDQTLCDKSAKFCQKSAQQGTLLNKITHQNIGIKDKTAFFEKNCAQIWAIFFRKKCAQRQKYRPNGEISPNLVVTLDAEHDQGDQIGRIFSNWAIVFFWV
jgi:hypothetical protein